MYRCNSYKECKVTECFHWSNHLNAKYSCKEGVCAARKDRSKCVDIQVSRRQKLERIANV